VVFSGPSGRDMPLALGFDGVLRSSGRWAPGPLDPAVFHGSRAVERQGILGLAVPRGFRAEGHQRIHRSGGSLASAKRPQDHRVQGQGDAFGRTGGPAAISRGSGAKGLVRGLAARNRRRDLPCRFPPSSRKAAAGHYGLRGVRRGSFPAFGLGTESGPGEFFGGLQRAGGIEASSEDSMRNGRTFGFPCSGRVR
jgi:hypothetical protein